MQKAKEKNFASDLSPEIAALIIINPWAERSTEEYQAIVGSRISGLLDNDDVERIQSSYYIIPLSDAGK